MPQGGSRSSNIIRTEPVHCIQAEELIKRIHSILEFKKRAVIAVAGVPGAGKSTLVGRMNELLSREKISSKLLPQDGFHYYRSELAKFPNPEEAFRRRGAPFTFDAERFSATVELLHENVSVTAPLFDHSLKDPVENDIVIGPEIQVVFVEGNYVGLKEAPWCNVSAASDEFWLVDTDPQLVRDRLIARHISSGVSANYEEAVERCDGLDGDNAQYIRTHLKTPDVIINLG